MGLGSSLTAKLLIPAILPVDTPTPERQPPVLASKKRPDPVRKEGVHTIWPPGGASGEFVRRQPSAF